MSIFAKISVFFENTAEEMRKCTWPDRGQLMESTILVLIVLIVSTIFIFGIDQVLFHIMKFLMSF